jgi:hypothetical protein
MPVNFDGHLGCAEGIFAVDRAGRGLKPCRTSTVDRCHRSICSQTDFQNKKFMKEVTQNV